jgi:hypothetical protein
LATQPAGSFPASGVALGKVTVLLPALHPPAARYGTVARRALKSIACCHWPLASACAARGTTAVRLWLPDAWKALIFIVVARLDEAFALIDGGMQAAERDGISANGPDLVHAAVPCPVLRPGGWPTRRPRPRR